MAPKVELHLHLEGAAPPAFIKGLAREKHVDLSRLFDAEGHYAGRGWAGFEKAYLGACTVLQGPRDFARLMRVVLEESLAQGVVYTELHLSPDLCGGGDLFAWRDHLAAMAEAASEMARDGIEARGIVAMIRNLGPDQARRVAACAAETAGGFLVGIGLAGDETIGAIRDHAWGFDCAREAGLRATIHAGEFAGPSSVRDALAMGAGRIGHGVRAIEDLALVDELAERGTVLEVCPGSNLHLGLYPAMRQHPVAELDRRGVKVTISTDDPAFFKTSLTREYEALNAAFDWDDGQFARLNRQALDAAFCDADTKAKLAQRLEAPHA